MRRYIPLLFFFLISSSAVPYSPPAIPRARSRERLTIYDGYRTPASILKGLARTESSFEDDAIGDDGISEGRFQHNRRFHAERAAKWGEFDPFAPLDGARIASCIIQENLKAFGSMDLAIAAYRQGLKGTRRDGAAIWYVRRVKP